MTLAQLSARLADAGRPISLTILSKIENRDRQLDVDDLDALSRALEVPIVELMADPAEAEAAVLLQEYLKLDNAKRDLEREIVERQKTLDSVHDVLAGLEERLATFPPEIRARIGRKTRKGR